MVSILAFLGATSVPIALAIQMAACLAKPVYQMVFLLRPIRALACCTATKVALGILICSTAMNGARARAHRRGVAASCPHLLAKNPRCAPVSELIVLKMS